MLVDVDLLSASDCQIGGSFTYQLGAHLLEDCICSVKFGSLILETLFHKIDFLLNRVHGFVLSFMKTLSDLLNLWLKPLSRLHLTVLCHLCFELLVCP